VRLTREERKAIYAGSEVALKRECKPDCKAGDTLVLGWSGGGKQFLDRRHEDRVANEGRTIDVPRKPTLWIRFSEPAERVRDGVTEWVVEFERFDHREPTRLLARSGGSDAYTPESERGYGGDSRTAIDHLEAVDDETLAQFVAETTPGNLRMSAERRLETTRRELEAELGQAARRDRRGRVKSLEKKLEQHDKRSVRGEV
jgi:hypothetical protein